MSTGNRIAELREAKGWTQEDLAAKLGITRAALSHYEKNRRKPDFETLTLLADCFEVSIDYLVGRTLIPDMNLSEPVRAFVDQLELSDEDMLQQFHLTIDGHQLTEEEAKRFIAFVRAERMMR
ncbi:helix-turn-helix domain-containing protein [Paenibacillus taiwanensis]|uniref:helix-turn-helix domain-containing protein n=1 Tax=Paenibacillus taiwanensis TaxID=401638 RepID=UPI0003FC81FB|nr:helix-turn-helix transcriptional regulator [Paenibacillus taiwanensis]